MTVEKKLTRQEKEELAALLEEKRRRQERLKSRSSCQHFITHHVRIEDRDEAVPLEELAEENAFLAEEPEDYQEKEDGIAVPFTLWEGQESVLGSFLIHRLLIILKARQLGLTWLALAYAVWRMVFFPGYQVVALSKKEIPDAKELIRRVKFILRHLPDWIIQEKKTVAKEWTGPVWDSAALSVTITHPGKEPSTLISMAATEDAGRSFTANLVILDEWAFQQYAEEIYTSAYPTINRPLGGQVIGLSTAKRLTFFESMWKLASAGKNKFKTVFLPWWTDPRRTPEWYEDTKKDLPNSYMQEYPATPEEAFSAGEGTAFPEFSVDVHVCDDFIPPAHWRRWMGADNGYTDPFAWYWFTVSEDGQVFIYREFTRTPEEPKTIYSDQARQVVELSSYCTVVDGEERSEKEPLDYVSIGRDAWNTHHRDEKGKTLIDYYREGGLYGFIPAVTDRRLRKSVWHEYLKPYMDENTGKMTAKVQICRSCRKLIETLPQLIVDEKDVEKVAECDIDHCLVGDTLVDTVYGQIPISELVGTTGLVQCFDEEFQLPTAARYYGVRKTAENMQVFEVALDDGRTFKATDYHPVLTERGWVCVSDLEPGDEIIDIGDGFYS